MLIYSCTSVNNTYFELTLDEQKLFVWGYRFVCKSKLYFEYLVNRYMTLKPRYYFADTLYNI